MELSLKILLFPEIFYQILLSDDLYFIAATGNVVY